VLKKVKIAVFSILRSQKGKVDSAISSGEGKEVTGMTIFHFRKKSWSIVDGPEKQSQNV
jgi:hypothetical protein